MYKDDGNRQLRRATFERTAWMEADKKLIPCMVIDISSSGAQMSVSDESNLPDDFSIRLTEDGKVRRSCHVVWRKPGLVEVAFTSRENVGYSIAL